MHYERTRDGFTVTTDPARLDLDAAHGFLTTAYWSQGIPRQVLERAFSRSLCFSLLEQGRGQIGLARVVSDLTTFAYLCDVYVLPDRRGRGLGRWLIECVMAHPDLATLRRFSLVTQDAHGLYSRFGFAPPTHPERHMEIVHRDRYRPEQQEQALPAAASVVEHFSNSRRTAETPAPFERIDPGGPRRPAAPIESNRELKKPC